MRGQRGRLWAPPNSAGPAPEPAMPQSKALEALGSALWPNSIHIYNWQQYKYQVYCFGFF